ncbi:MAG TPA: ATP-binding cassette domain-containing protein [Chthonomonadaceae bacterium]|nr:ATP-binding cassette domain-containing protein [Chthonomonadaceae bacterium]
MIDTKHLCKDFYDKKRGHIHAVNNVSFCCRPGEIFGLLGPNGAGKTTLLRMLATILEPTSGTATVAGYDIREHPQEVRQRIGYLSSSTALYERLTAREMVAYFGALYGMTPGQIAQRIEAIFTELDMHEFADTRCDKLSTGQKQRVSIARTIIHQPPVLFFDEPTNGLDVVTARTIIRFIRRCREEGRTVVFSTHIMSEVETLCDTIAVIFQGQIAAIGTLEELRARTGKQAFEAVFLSLIGMDEDDA